MTGENYCKRNLKVNTQQSQNSWPWRYKWLWGNWDTHTSPLERLRNKHTVFQNKQDTKQPTALHNLSFENDMKIDTAISEWNIPGLFQQTEIREFTRKSELCKDFQLYLSATKRYIHTSEFVGHEIMLHSNTSLRKILGAKKYILTSKIHSLVLFLY